MEVAALFGMATKYAEGLLAVKYREVAPDGRVLGGPFYYIERGLGPKWKPLAVTFAVFGMVAGLLGIGTLTQVHGIVAAAQRFFDPGFNPADPSTGISFFGTVFSPAVMIAGAVVTACVALVIIGGLKRIAKVSMVVVPFMAVSYTLVCLLVMFGNYEKIPAALMTIVKAAFDPAAVTGGAVGTVFMAMQKGIARGIFSNEAGLGSEPIAAAAARTNEPAKQGLVSMTGTFIDTFVVCTMTGLTIVLSGAWDPSLKLEGANVTVEAFTRGLSFLPCAASVVPCFLMMALAFFAFTTILGWDYYSEKCLEYLVGMDRPRVVKLYRMLYVVMVAVGPYLTLSVVWGVADIFNGLMAFPNLIALMLLSPVVMRVTREFLDRRHR
jgi:AGCS family alanine or glycine:cation symporter